MGTRRGECLVFPINEHFEVSRLPQSLAARWARFSPQQNDIQRANALRRATRGIYSPSKGDRSPVKRWRAEQMSDMRAKAAEAAASLAARSSSLEEEDDSTAALAARLLAHMEAAAQRRQEAQQARRVRLATKHDLLLQRLARSPTKGAGGASDPRRSQFLAELQARVALACTADEATNHADTALQQLVAEASNQPWLAGLSPQDRMAAATLHLSHSSKRVQRAWRRFASQQQSTTQLAQAFVDQGVSSLDSQAAEDESAAAAAAAEAPAGPEEEEGEVQEQPLGPIVMIGGMGGSSAAAAKHAVFEEFAAKLQSPVTIRSAQALLRRLEKRLAVRGVSNDAAESLLRALSPSAPRDRKLERYPVRVMLCAYMVEEHPEVVFNKVGDIEARLSAAGVRMLAAFNALLRQLLQPAAAASSSPAPAAPEAPAAYSRSFACPSPLAKSMTSYLSGPPSTAAAATAVPPSVARQLFPAAGGAFGSPAPSPFSAVAGSPAASPPSLASLSGSASSSPASRGVSPLVRAATSPSLASLLVAFDDSWLEYLDQFVVWKGRDAASLEQELMRMAVRLERSMRLKLGHRELDSPEVRANPDLQAMVAQVSHDHALLAERIERLTGAEGSARLRAALAHVRQQVEKELAAAAEEAAAAAAEAAAAGVDEARPKTGLSRPGSRAGSLIDPLSEAEALAAAQAAASQDAAASGAQAAASAAPAAAPAAPESADALSNEQMVWEMLYNPDYSLPTADAVAAWHRAMGKQPDAEAEEVDPESMTPEQLTALVAGRARMIAEQAFWDSIVWRFKTAAQGQALPTQLAPLLSELGTELSGFVGDAGEGQALAEAYAEAAVLTRLTSSSGQQGGGANLSALGSMMEQLAQALLRCSGQERAAEGADATRELHARMAAALATSAAADSPASDASSSSSSSPQQAQRREEAAAAAALAEALAAALRLLMTQLKLVKLDAANTRLAGLARVMREHGAVSYLQTKLAAAWQLPALDATSSSSERQQAAQQLARDKLLRTAAWLGQVRHGLQQQLQVSLSNAGLMLDPAAAAAAVVAGGLASVELRSGVRASPTASPGARSPQAPRSPAGGSGGAASPGSSAPWSLSGASSPSGGAAGAVRPRFPVALDSHQGMVRAGLLALVISDTPAVSPELPEVLGCDRARLHDLQNALQQLMVAAAGLLIVQQLRQAAGLPWDAELRAAARRRLLITLSDPSMKLAHLVTELTQLAGAGAVATEERVRHMFTTIVNPEASAFKSIRSGITAALAAHLLYGRAAMAADGSAASSCGAVLGRVGAAALAADVAELGQRLAAVAAVCEAVHGSTLELLASAIPAPQ